MRYVLDVAAGLAWWLIERLDVTSSPTDGCECLYWQVNDALTIVFRLIGG